MMKQPPQALAEDVRALAERLRAIPGLDVRVDELLARHTRFAIGGPASLFITARAIEPLSAGLAEASSRGIDVVVIGGGTNLVASDSGFRGAIFQYAASAIDIDCHRATARADSGAVLQSLVDRTIAAGLQNFETMTGIPGWTGGAVYGNAGAYGRSISESLLRVRFYDGRSVRTLDNAGCEFTYRESIFKRRKNWVVLDAEFALNPHSRTELEATSCGILTVRNEKYPPSMKCAGSIFKNCFFAQLPPDVQARVPGKLVREGKVPSAFFLEQAGAKGIRRGDIQVATYHANLIYNDGIGSATDLVAVIRHLKNLVEDKFGFLLEEEVQYLGDFS